MNITEGRRVSSVAELEHPGDYCGPILWGETLACLFLLPALDAPPSLQGIHHVAFPPHRYRECPDGSLEIPDSIGVRGEDGEFLWHGYLDEGHRWREL